MSPHYSVHVAAHSIRYCCIIIPLLRAVRERYKPAPKIVISSSYKGL